jgi:predicted nucleotidyltransferase
VPSLEDLRRRRRELLLIAERHGASAVRVFGSIVRGDVGPGSDLDLLVEMGDIRHPFLRFWEDGAIASGGEAQAGLELLGRAEQSSAVGRC